MATRYKIAGDWTTRTVDEHETWSGDVVRVEIDTATLVDTRTGNRFTHGARRVTVKMPGKKRTRTFRGEMAWIEAKRWTDDVVWEMRRNN